MSNLSTTRLSKPIAYFQLEQQGVFVSVTDMLTELRIEFESDRINYDQLGMNQCLAVISYLQLVFDSVPIDGPVPLPNDYLTKN